MKQTVEIGGRRYTLCASVYTIVLYRGLFGRELLDDLLSGEDGAYIRVFYVLACEGGSEIAGFEEWADNTKITAEDMANIILSVSQLWTAAARVSRRNRAQNSGSDGTPVRCDELCVMLLSAGLTLSDMHSLTLGMALDILHERIRSIRRANGEQVTDPEEQYRIAVGNLPDVRAAYEAGTVSREDYERYIEAIRRWEDNE